MIVPNMLSSIESSFRHAAEFKPIIDQLKAIITVLNGNLDKQNFPSIAEFDGLSYFSQYLGQAAATMLYDGTFLVQTVNAMTTNNGSTWNSLDTSKPSWRTVLDPTNDRLRVERAPATAGTLAWATVGTFRSNGLVMTGSLNAGGVLNAGGDANITGNLYASACGLGGLTPSTAGEIRPTGYRQPGTNGEKLKIIRGIIAATGTTPLAGGGFTVTDGGTGIKTANFTTGFSDLPAITVGSCREDADIHVMFDTVTASSVRFLTRTYPLNVAVDARFHFAAIGPVA